MPVTRVVTGNVFAMSEGSAPLKKDFSRLIQHTAMIRTPSAGVAATRAKTG
jgi:hypothetical protein